MPVVPVWWTSSMPSPSATAPPSEQLLSAKTKPIDTHLAFMLSHTLAFVFFIFMVFFLVAQVVRGAVLGFYRFFSPFFCMYIVARAATLMYLSFNSFFLDVISVPRIYSIQRIAKIVSWTSSMQRVERVLVVGDFESGMCGRRVYICRYFGQFVIEY